MVTCGEEGQKLASFAVTFFLNGPKDVYPSENMNSRQKFNETSFSDKKEFYSKLTRENVTKYKT